ncbi:hypothetical protein KY495_00395 [Massilia sp. PAMC28688]|uniref:hypothetical protein n=1 Tax=Massilia sp. PAMC28688 TaxID=2861283 RepID=UPI001C62BFF2|nr:hypothetical protein [Massilia sp. PAMC28688]QYF93737.1 hypothetical protein KY495_00395 [Massilia sp. PAMC28688]
MKLTASLLCTVLWMTGCQTMPDTADTTPAKLRFRIHYHAPGLTTPMSEVETTTSVAAGRCVYVNSPFGVVANVADKGGVRSIVIGPSAFFGALAARANPGDIIAIPGPAETTQTVSGMTFPNPGKQPGSAVTQVRFSTAKAYDTVTLLTVYEFNGANRGALRATARNWGATTGVSEVYNFFVERADPGNPARRAGMPCSVPAGG